MSKDWSPDDGINATLCGGPFNGEMKIPEDREELVLLHQDALLRSFGKRFIKHSVYERVVAGIYRYIGIRHERGTA